MKPGKLELVLIAIAAAAVIFTAGYFSGRARTGGVYVTVAPGLSDDVTAESLDGRIDLNTASRWELMSLPGIGGTLADRIIAYRDENGRFGSVAELMEVRGIGESLYDAIKDLLKV